MAVGNTLNMGFDIEAGKNGSGFCDWLVCNDDTSTAQSASDLLGPGGIDDSVFHWVKLAPGTTRVYIRCRYDDGTSAVATSPIVRLFGAVSDPQTVAEASNKFRRLDNADWNASGVTLTLVANGTGVHHDGTDFYSDEPTLSGYDALGCRYVGVAIETASSITPDTNPVVEIFGTN